MPFEVGVNAGPRSQIPSLNSILLLPLLELNNAPGTLSYPARAVVHGTTVVALHEKQKYERTQITARPQLRRTRENDRTNDGLTSLDLQLKETSSAVWPSTIYKIFKMHKIYKNIIYI